MQALTTDRFKHWAEQIMLRKEVIIQTPLSLDEAIHQLSRATGTTKYFSLDSNMVYKRYYGVIEAPHFKVDKTLLPTREMFPIKISGEFHSSSARGTTVKVTIHPPVSAQAFQMVMAAFATIGVTGLWLTTIQTGGSWKEILVSLIGSILLIVLFGGAAWLGNLLTRREVEGEIDFLTNLFQSMPI